MGTLYCQAAEVVVWLDVKPEYPFSERAYTALQQCIPSSPYDAVGVNDDTSSNRKNSLPLLFLHQKYWTRLWVVEEILLARVLTVRYAKLRCDFAQLTVVYEMSELGSMADDLQRGWWMSWTQWDLQNPNAED